MGLEIKVSPVRDTLQFLDAKREFILNVSRLLGVV
jgi:hypothetical protein